MTYAAFSIKFAKTNQKVAENSEFYEKNSLLLVNYSLHSLGAGPADGPAQDRQPRARTGAGRLLSPDEPQAPPRGRRRRGLPAAAGAGSDTSRLGIEAILNEASRALIHLTAKWCTISFLLKLSAKQVVHRRRTR